MNLERFLFTKGMALTVSIYYSGENGTACKFAEEMMLSGIAADEFPSADIQYIKE